MDKRRKRKILRRRCADPACKRLYRYADPRSLFCSQRCRQSAYRERKKAEAQAERERVQAASQELSPKWQAIFERLQTEREAAPGPTAPHHPTAHHHPTEPAPPPRLDHFPTPEPEERVVIIRPPKRAPMTPI